MCDIYYAKCAKCDVEIDMHLADFETLREEVEVYCKAHIPEDKTNGVLWNVEEDDVGEVFVTSLTDNAKNMWEGNHPNNGYFTAIEAFGKRLINGGESNIVTLLNI